MMQAKNCTEWFQEQFEGQFQFQHQGISTAKKP